MRRRGKTLWCRCGCCWIETDIHRLNIAKQYGCDVIAGDASAWAKQRDGLGADCVIDAAGTSITLKIALELVRPNGHITKVGWGLSRWLLARSAGAEKCYVAG